MVSGPSNNRVSLNSSRYFFDFDRLVSQFPQIPNALVILHLKTHLFKWFKVGFYQRRFLSVIPHFSLLVYHFDDL